MNDMVKNIVPRLSDNERLVMGLPFEQLDMLGGEPGITVDRHWKVPNATVKSLKSRFLIKGGIDAHTRIMPLTELGARVAAAVRADCRVVDGALPLRTCTRGHELTPENTQRVGIAGDRCRICRQRIAREWARNHG